MAIAGTDERYVGGEAPSPGDVVEAVGPKGAGVPVGRRSVLSVQSGRVVVDIGGHLYEAPASLFRLCGRARPPWCWGESFCDGNPCTCHHHDCSSQPIEAPCACPPWP